MTTKKRFICPRCKWDFNQRKKKCCPGCGVRLSLFCDFPDWPEEGIEFFIQNSNPSDGPIDWRYYSSMEHQRQHTRDCLERLWSRNATDGMTVPPGRRVQ